MVLVPLLVLEEADVAHALDAVDGFFQRNGDGLLDRVGIGAHVVGGDRYLRRRQLRIQRDRQGGDAHRSGQDDHQRADGGEDRPVDEEIDKQGKPSFLRLQLGAHEVTVSPTAAAEDSASSRDGSLRAQRHHRHVIHQELSARHNHLSPAFNPEVTE